jgi:hypothetical protein
MPSTHDGGRMLMVADFEQTVWSPGFFPGQAHRTTFRTRGHDRFRRRAISRNRVASVPFGLVIAHTTTSTV